MSTFGIAVSLVVLWASAAFGPLALDSSVSVRKKMKIFLVAHLISSVFLAGSVIFYYCLTRFWELYFGANFTARLVASAITPLLVAEIWLLYREIRCNKQKAD